MAIKNKRPSSSGFFDDANSSPLSNGEEAADFKPVTIESAIVYCEGSFGTSDGEIANALVRKSRNYRLLSVIDSEKAEKDAGKVLDGEKNGLPIYRDLGTALAQAGGKPAYLIFGKTSAGGVLSQAERRVLLRAMAYKINIACGSHESLNEDPEFVAACEKGGVVIRAV